MTRRLFDRDLVELPLNGLQMERVMEIREDRRKITRQMQAMKKTYDAKVATKEEMLAEILDEENAILESVKKPDAEA